MNAGIAKARTLGTKVLAWISFGFAVAGGAALAATWAAGWIVAPIKWLPSSQVIAVVALVFALLGMALDIFIDFVPDRFAVWMGILLPTLATATSGKLSAKVTELANQVLSQVSGGLTGWIGQTSKTAIAAVCITAALVMAKRVVRKSGGGMDL